MGRSKFVKRVINIFRRPSCMSRKATEVKDSVVSLKDPGVNVKSAQPAASSSCSAKPPVYPMLQPTTGTMAQHHVNQKYSGSQCTTAAMMALAYHSFKEVSSWTADDIDNILLVGSRHHVHFRDKLCLSNNPDGRISLDEVPDMKYLPFSVPEAEDIYFARRYMDMTGLVALSGDRLCDVDMFEKYPPLSITIHKILMNGKLCAVTIGQFTVAVVQNNNLFWLLDSHARDQYGRIDADGTAIAMPFTSIEELACHLARTYGSQQQYNAVGLQFHTVDELEDDVEILL